MTRLFSSASIVILAVLFVLLAMLLKKKGIGTDHLIKGGSIALLIVSFARYIYDQPPIYYLKGLDGAASPFNSPTPQPGLTLYALLLVWFAYAAMLTIVLNSFYKYKTLANIVTCFSIPVYLLTLISHDIYAVASLGTELYALSTVRLWMMNVEIALALGVSVAKILLELKLPCPSKEKFPSEIGISVPENKNEALSFLFALPMAIIAIMPCFIPQAIIGQIDYSLRLYDLTEAHRIMIYISVVLPIIGCKLLRDKPEDTRRFVAIYMSLAFFWAYIGRWNLEMLSNPLELPFHLCNTAMFLIPLCLIFRMEKLFNFCLFINVLGAMFAMVMPSEHATLTAIETERVSFWLNHYAAFGFPLLLISLKLFKKPKFKEWVYSVIEFTVYYVLILFINAWFSNYGSVDFFFVNGDFIVSTLGPWAEKTMDITASFSIGELNFTFYPLYQALFYIVYIGFTVGMWFLYELLFTMWEKADDRRLRERDYKRMKKELNEYLGGRTIYEPVGGDASPRIKLIHFSKRYGSNKHYSVNDVSFEVVGGEIFGFLGPNGAGKSTIIKSMVGIQTITSGNIELCGFDVDKQPVMAKHCTGFVPDHYALYENLTGREYINYIADLYQVGQKYRDETIEKYVERFQLTGSFDNQMKTYSHGMKQKITIMAALVHNPKVWILDEPLTGLDPTSIHEVKECMKEHAAKGNVVFFSSHIIDLVEKLCDRIAIIKKGQLRASASIKELTDKGIELERFYLDTINNSDDEHVPYVEGALKAGAKGDAV